VGRREGGTTGVCEAVGNRDLWSWRRDRKLLRGRRGEKSVTRKWVGRAVRRLLNTERIEERGVEWRVSPAGKPNGINASCGRTEELEKIAI